MKGILQAVTFFYLCVAALDAADPQKSFAWEPLKIQQSMFSKDIGMLDSERDEYATNLAIYASNMITASKASAQSLADARRVMGLSLHLSPRNKRAIVTSYQLSKGLLPEAIQTNYSPQVLARLLLTRGQVLGKQGGDENKKLARYFIHLSAVMDPKNDDAVYASEVQRLDHGDMDWTAVTQGAPKPAPVPVLEPPPE